MQSWSPVSARTAWGQHSPSPWQAKIQHFWSWLGAPYPRSKSRQKTSPPSTRASISVFWNWIWHHLSPLTPPLPRWMPIQNPASISSLIMLAWWTSLSAPWAPMVSRCTWLSTILGPFASPIASWASYSFAEVGSWTSAVVAMPCRPSALPTTILLTSPYRKVNSPQRLFAKLLGCPGVWDIFQQLPTVRVRRRWCFTVCSCANSSVPKVLQPFALTQAVKTSELEGIIEQIDWRTW